MKFKLLLLFALLYNTANTSASAQAAAAPSNSQERLNARKVYIIDKLNVEPINRAEMNHVVITVLKKDFFNTVIVSPDQAMILSSFISSTTEQTALMTMETLHTHEEHLLEKKIAQLQRSITSIETSPQAQTPVSETTEESILDERKLQHTVIIDLLIAQKTQLERDLAHAVQCLTKAREKSCPAAA